MTSSGNITANQQLFDNALSRVIDAIYVTISVVHIRPWPNDSIFHSIFSSTFDLKVERLLSVVEHRWPNGSIFRSTFLSTFQLLIFPQRVSAKNIYHHKYLTA